MVISSGRWRHWTARSSPHPAFANRCVYARNDKEIVCVSLRELGRAALEAQARELIYDDGGFSQHAANYQRVMLEDYLWCIQLTVILIDPKEFGADTHAVREALERENIEARPVWKPMHLQPVFAGCRVRSAAGGVERGREVEVRGRRSEVGSPAFAPWAAAGKRKAEDRERGVVCKGPMPAVRDRHDGGGPPAGLRNDKKRLEIGKRKRNVERREGDSRAVGR